MKAWTTATAAGQCSFDSAHHWKQGDAVFAVSGVGWSKKFCPSCAMQRHGAGEVPILEPATPQPSVRPSFNPLKAMADQVAEQFDVKRAQAGDREVR